MNDSLTLIEQCSVLVIRTRTRAIGKQFRTFALKLTFEVNPVVIFGGFNVLTNSNTCNEVKET